MASFSATRICRPADAGSTLQPDKVVWYLEVSGSGRAKVYAVATGDDQSDHAGAQANSYHLHLRRLADVLINHGRCPGIVSGEEPDYLGAGKGEGSKVELEERS